MDYVLPASVTAGTGVAAATGWYFDAGPFVALGLLTIYTALAYYLLAFDVTLRDLGSPSVDDRSGRLLHSLAFAAFGLTSGWVLDVQAQSGSAGLFIVWLFGFLGFVTVSATVDQEDSPTPGALSGYTR